MQTSKAWQFLGLSAVILLSPLWAVAQQSQAPANSAPQPKLEKLEEGEPPSIKMGKPQEKHKITETRDDSGVKEVKVESGKSTYYVKPNEQVGTALPGDAQSSGNRGAQWKVLEFDLGSKNKKAEEGGTSPADEPPPSEPKK